VEIEDTEIEESTDIDSINAPSAFIWKKPLAIIT